MKKLFSSLNQVPKHIWLMAAIVFSAVVIPAALYAWGPSRPTYTYASPSNHVTFNSITDNPDVGDERNFIRIKEDSTTSTYVDSVTLEPGKVYQVMAYYHNNAASNLNASGIGVAKNATLRMEIPGVVKAGVKAVFTGTVSASNANPTSVYDEAYGTNATSADIALRYVSGSATVTSNGAVNGAKLPDSLFTTGTNLGYDSLNGVLNGCNKYAGYVVFKIRVDQPNFTIKKQVSVDNGTTWVDDSVKAEAGSTVQYRIIYQNTGTSQQDNVSLRDILPAGVTYVAGSSQIANSTTGGAYKPTVDGVTTNGYNAGSYQPKGNAYFKFNAKVADNDSLPNCGDNALVNTAKATTSGGAKEDTATITVTKTCKPVAAYTCDALSATKLTRTSMRFTTNYTVSNATFKSVTYVIKDESGKVIDTKTSTDKTLDYNQTIAGKYTVQATVTVSVDGTDATATSEGCKAAFEITDEPVVPAYTCDALAVTKLTRTSVRFTTTYTVKDATFTGVVYIIKDVNGKIVDTKTSAADTLEYTQNTVGKYTVQATITAIANGKDVTATSEGCKVAFEITNEPVVPVVPVTPVTPTAPTELPTTGPGETLISIIGLGALIASLGYYIASRRSL